MRGWRKGQCSVLLYLFVLVSIQAIIHPPTYLPTDTAEEEIPANFLKACKGNVEKAGKKWLVSKQWRDENDIGTFVF